MKALTSPDQNFLRICLILIFTLTAILLVAGAAQKSFWIDEAATVRRAMEISSRFEQAYLWRNHFLVDWSMGMWGSLWGWSEIALRSLAILWALVALGLTYLLARDLLGIPVGLIAVAILGLSPLFLLFAHNARYYSLAAVLTLSGALAIFRYHSSGGWRYVLFYFFSVFLLYSTMLQAIIVVAVLNVWWFILWIQKRERTWVEMGAWLLVNIAAAVFNPSWLLQSNAAISVHYGLPESSSWIFEILKRSAFLGFAFSLGETISPLNPIAWVGLGLVAGVGIYAMVANRRVLNFWLPVIFVISSGFAGVLMSMTSPWLSTIWQSLPVWVFFALPFFSIWLAAGFAKFHIKPAVVVGGLLLLVYGVGIANYFEGRQFISPVYTVPWREIFDKIQSETGPDDVVICGRGDYACRYYLDVYGFRNQELPKFDLLADGDYPDIWWVQSNLAGQSEIYPGVDFDSILDELHSRYQSTEVFNYVPQDATIRWMKRILLDKEDYEYRINLYWFYNP